MAEPNPNLVMIRLSFPFISDTQSSPLPFVHEKWERLGETVSSVAWTASKLLPIELFTVTTTSLAQ